MLYHFISSVRIFINLDFNTNYKTKVTSMTTLHTPKTAVIEEFTMSILTMCGQRQANILKVFLLSCNTGQNFSTHGRQLMS